MSVNAQKYSITHNALFEVELTRSISFFPFVVMPLMESLKYIWFLLMSDSYKKLDWKWLVTKIEKKSQALEFQVAFSGWVLDPH